MTGIDMINTMMSTSMTSMSGVVLISIIGAPSSAAPTLIDMKRFLESSASDANAAAIRFGDETDLHDAAALQVVDDPADLFPTHGLVAADVELRLGHLSGFRHD